MGWWSDEKDCGIRAFSGCGIGFVSVENRKAVQLISDDDAYSVKHAIYEQLMAQKAVQA